MDTMGDGVVEGSFRHRLRTGTLTGFWCSLPNPISIERLAGLGFDYLCLDQQHGVIGYDALVGALVAVDAAGGRRTPAERTAAIVRVPVLDRGDIGRALDAGADAVIVPMIETLQEAEAAALACRYAPAGQRSWGPVRSGLRIGPEPRVADGSVACIVMIETARAVEQVEAIAAVPGVDALYVGPADLSLSLGAPTPRVEDRLASFEPSIARVVAAARTAGKGVIFHVPDGQAALAAHAAGFTAATVSDDLGHLEAAVRAQLAVVRAP